MTTDPNYLGSPQDAKDRIEKIRQDVYDLKDMMRDCLVFDDRLYAGGCLNELNGILRHLNYIEAGIDKHAAKKERRKYL